MTSYSKKMLSGVLVVVSLLAGSVLAAEGDDLAIKITEKMAAITVQHQGKPVRIQRIQDEENSISGGFAKTSRKCPPFCVHAMLAAPGVTTVGELELIDFIKQRVETGKGLLIDARTPEWHAKGTIPGSVNLPFTAFGQPDNDPELVAALAKTGVKPRTPGFLEKLIFKIKTMFGMAVNERAMGWDFREARELLLWCNGPWCDQSPRAIRNLMALGYPAGKLFYYRGGMQDWLVLGLSIVVPAEEPAAASK
jgi:rhodanese-related sulfurtransferase